MSSKIKISIIINNYNLDIQYVTRALDSIKNQTYKNLECIIVDDGSKKELIHENYINSLVNEDKRFKLIKSKNQGLGPARNVGVCNSSGDVIIFLDGDDYLTNDACEFVVENFEKYNPDFLHFNHLCLTSDNCKLPREKIYVVCKNNNPNEINLNDYKQIQRVKFAMSRKFIKQNKIEFYTSRDKHEDVYYCLLIKTLAKKIVFTNKILYYYDTVRPGSITNTDNISNSKQFIQYICWAYEWLLENGYDLEMFYVNVIYYMGKFIGNDYGQKYRKIFFDDNKYIKSKKNSSKKWRIIYFFYKHKSLHGLFNFLFNQKWLRKIVRAK